MNVTKNSKVRSKVRSTDTTIQQPAHMPSGNTTALRKYRRAFWVSQYFQKSCFPTMAYCIFCDMSQFTTPPPHPHPLSGAQIRSITALASCFQVQPGLESFPPWSLPDPLNSAHSAAGHTGHCLSAGHWPVLSATNDHPRAKQTVQRPVVLADARGTSPWTHGSVTKCAV